MSQFPQDSFLIFGQIAPGCLKLLKHLFGLDRFIGVKGLGGFHKIMQFQECANLINEAVDKLSNFTFSHG